MSQKIKTPKSVWITLVAGIGLGAASMAMVQSGFVITKSYAKQPGIMRTAGTEKTESLAELHNLDSSFANLADFVAPSVVDIHAKTTRASDSGGARMPVKEGEGSGFVIRSDGYIMTNDHVVNGADEVTVTMKDGREYTGKVVSSMDNDIAIVKIEAKDLPTLAFADSSELRPGQMVMAVGAPFGLENSVTFGHVSALGRETGIQSNATDGRFYPDLIQTDASINMGNSGGPLVNVDGQVVGVNTAIYSPSGTSAGIGFAIPSNQAKFVSDILLEKGKITRSMIGILPENLKDYEKKDKGLSGGAVVAELPPSGVAAKAGIKKGDIITKIGNSTINSQLDLRNSMLVYAPNTTVDVHLLRDGKPMTISVKLEAYKKPEQPKQQQMPGEWQQSPNGKGKFFQSPEGGDGDQQKKMLDEMRKHFEDQMDRGNQGQSDDRSDDVPAIKEGHARLGVSVGPPSKELRTEFSIPDGVNGAIVMNVQDGSVADKLGLREGDIITQLGDVKITDGESLTRAMANVNWGDTKKIKFGHYGKGSQSTREETVTFK